MGCDVKTGVVTVSVGDPDPGHRPSVTVTSPNGGENWIVDSYHPITWNANYLTATTYALDYSLNNGSTWIPITTVAGTQSSYNWVVPSNPTDQALVRITGVDGTGTALC